MKENEMGGMCSKYGGGEIHKKVQCKIIDGRDIMGELSLSYLRL